MRQDHERTTPSCLVLDHRRAQLAWLLLAVVFAAPGAGALGLAVN
jgi:hypothetical protein